VIEDLIAQNHQLVDTLTYDQGRIARSVMQTVGETRDQGGPFAQLTGINLRSVDKGHCIGELTVRHHHLNPLDIAHGGVAYTLADHICGVAALTAVSRSALVTQDMHLRYHAPARLGTLVAEGHVLHKGKRTITVTARITQNETLVASVTATYAILTTREQRRMKGDSPT